MTQSATFIVTGMKCGGCENNVIQKLTALEGVISAVADYKEHYVSIEFKPEIIEIDDLEDVIIAAGFGVE